MKGKKLTTIFIAIIVVAGAAWFFINKGSSTDTGNITQNSSESEPFSGTLKAAVALGVPMKCSYKVNGVEYSGLIKGKQYKGNVKMQDGKEGSVLMKENCMYTWSDVDKQGIKTCFDESEQSIWDQPEGSTTNVSMPTNYTCQPALVTDSEFDLPSDVNFMDLDALMNNPDAANFN